MKKLIEAYKYTQFVVTGTSIIIEPGKPNDELDVLLQEENCTAWAFITAWNPYSKQLDAVKNILRHEKLLFHVSQYKYYEGYGVGIDSSWEPEKSLLVLGIPKQAAIEIGNAFEQNAIVTGEKGGEAELVVLNQYTSAIQKDQKNLSAFMQALNSGKTFDELDKEMQRWWMNRY